MTFQEEVKNIPMFLWSSISWCLLKGISASAHITVYGIALSVLLLHIAISTVTLIRKILKGDPVKDSFVNFIVGLHKREKQTSQSQTALQ
ncbi:hypothetical protein WA026_018177 [Henosepilachna vigintioctopunctata]|uniref:Uncharacterized protein n=1 Tax=Henosepilachna vigintioctopunctata TaxID=420089 RepID=A0AAW1UPT4_9CUCU